MTFAKENIATVIRVLNIDEIHTNHIIHLQGIHHDTHHMASQVHIVDTLQIVKDLHRLFLPQGDPQLTFQHHQNTLQHQLPYLHHHQHRHLEVTKDG